MPWIQISIAAWQKGNSLVLFELLPQTNMLYKQMLSWNLWESFSPFNIWFSEMYARYSMGCAMMMIGMMVSLRIYQDIVLVVIVITAEEWPTMTWKQILHIFLDNFGAKLLNFNAASQTRVLFHLHTVTSHSMWGLYPWKGCITKKVQNLVNFPIQMHNTVL